MVMVVLAGIGAITAVVGALALLAILVCAGCGWVEHRWEDVLALKRTIKYLRAEVHSVTREWEWERSKRFTMEQKIEGLKNHEQGLKRAVLRARRFRKGLRGEELPADVRRRARIAAARASNDSERKRESAGEGA